MADNKYYPDSVEIPARYTQANQRAVADAPYRALIHAYAAVTRPRQLMQVSFKAGRLEYFKAYAPDWGLTSANVGVTLPSGSSGSIEFEGYIGHLPETYNGIVAHLCFDTVPAPEDLGELSLELRVTLDGSTGDASLRVDEKEGTISALMPLDFNQTELAGGKTDEVVTVRVQPRGCIVTPRLFQLFQWANYDQNR